jgi:hypothetical protein
MLPMHCVPSKQDVSMGRRVGTAAASLRWRAAKNASWWTRPRPRVLLGAQVLQRCHGTSRKGHWVRVDMLGLCSGPAMYAEARYIGDKQLNRPSQVKPSLHNQYTTACKMAQTAPNKLQKQDLKSHIALQCTFTQSFTPYADVRTAVAGLGEPAPAQSRVTRACQVITWNNIESAYLIVHSPTLCFDTV